MSGPEAVRHAAIAVRRRTPGEESEMVEPRRLRDVVNNDPLLLTPEEAAEVLRIGRTTVYALMRAGDLRPVHIGRSCRLSRAELQRYVDRLESPAPPRLGRPHRHRVGSTDDIGLRAFTPDQSPL